MSILIRHLDTVGDGSGSKNFNGNYSVTQGIAKIAPPPGEVYELNDLIVGIEDTSGFRAEYYGSIAGKLTNGIAGSVHGDDGLVVDLTDGHSIKANAEWSYMGYDTVLKTWGPGNEFLIAQMHFHNLFGCCMGLNGNSGDYLQFTFDDDLRDLIEHHFIVTGAIRKIT